MLWKKMDLSNIGSLNKLLKDKEFKLTKEVMKVTFSDDESKIIQTTELNNQDLRMATVIEMIDSFVIEPYCYDNFLKEQWKIFKKRLYQMRVSKDRKGRKELFDSLKTDIHISDSDKKKTEIK